MAKTFRNLWPRLVSWDNLLLAYRKCRRRKRYRQVATAFEFRWEENLLQLQRELLDGSYQHGPYYHFHITDPKPRKISAAPFRDRLVHHALVAMLEPIFERQFVFDSYACRIGKGTHRAIRRCQHLQRRFPWCLKTDIVRFFPCVDHEILLNTVRRRIADPQVMSLIELILRSGESVHADEAHPGLFPGDDLFAALRPRGLPIGNLTSQFFANVFLDPVDHVIKEELRIPGYVRYADDLLLFGNSREQLWQSADDLRCSLGSRRLRLHPHKTHVVPTRKSMTFLGFQVGPDSLRLPQTGILRFSRRLRRQRLEFAQSRISFPEIHTSLTSWFAHTSHANSTSIVASLVRQHARFRRQRRLP